jgi:nucleoside-diphosphate-sugar epimerase
MTDPDFMISALSGSDTVFHIAGIQLSKTLADAAIRCCVRRLILVHTTGIYSKYKAAGAGYRQIDEYVTSSCRDAGISLSILRPTMIYGNTSDRNVITFIRMVDRLPLMPVVRGARYALQPVHYRDLSHAYLRVLLQEETTSGRNYVLSGAEPILLRDMLSCIGGELGKRRVRFLSVPFWFAYGGAVCLWAVSFGKKDLREKVQRLCEPRAYPHREASKDFGFDPVAFPDGISEEISQYLNEKNSSRCHG